MANKKWLKILKGKVKNFDEAVEESKNIKDFGQLADGQYPAEVQSSEIAESKNGRPQINMTVEVVGDIEEAGETPMCFLGLDEASLKYTLNKLNKLGYEIEDIEDIADVVEALNEDQPECTIRVSNGFADILKGPEDEPEEEEEEEDDEEEEEEEEDDEEEEEEEEVEEDPEDEPIELSEGDWVKFESRGKEFTGEIVQVVGDGEKVKVKTEDGKTKTVSTEILEPTEKPKPKKKPVKKKTAPAKKKPAKKKSVRRKR